MPRDYTAKAPLPQSRYGRLSIIANAKGGWLCRCDCGTEKVVRAQALKSGSTKSCGCYQKSVRRQPRTHGMTYTAIYRLWVSMKDRCYRESVPNYPFYGGRGIKVCERWHTFTNFYADMGQRPDGHSLNRINNDGDYEPANCRWSKLSEQSRNTRRNRMLTLDGTTRSLIEWAELHGLHPETLASRLRRGWPLSRALAKTA